MRPSIVLQLSVALSAAAFAAVPAAQTVVDETIKPQARTIAAGNQDVVLDAVGGVWVTAPGQTSLSRLSGLPPGVTATAVEAGPHFTLLLGSNGAVYGTGSNQYGQLTGEDAADVTGMRPLTGLPTGVKATAISAGADFSIVIGSNGVAYGTGRNQSVQLTGATGDRTSLTPMTGLPTGTRAVSADAGADFTVVMDSAGRVYGTGSNSSHQLTLAAVGDVNTLTAFTGMPSGYVARAVAASADSSAVLLSDRRIVSAGLNSAGQLGNGTQSATTAPVVATGSGFVGIAANPLGDNVLAVGSDGGAYGTGANADGQLTGSAAVQTSFTRLAEPADLDKVVEVAAGERSTIVRDARGVAYQAGGGASSSVSLTLVPGQAFVAADRPSFMTGATVSAGDVVSANSATWSPHLGASSWQWLRDGQPIRGATEQEYAVVEDDHSTSLSVRETRTAAGFIKDFRDSDKVAVAAPHLTATKAPTISGASRVGSVLTMTDASFEPQPEDGRRAWYRDGVAIKGASGTSYRLALADAGRRIAVRSIGIKPGYDDGAATSATRRIPIVNTARPTVTGTAKVGKRLRIRSKGTWYGPASYSYQWYRGSTKISGATKTSYKLTKKDRKKRLTVRVSGKRSGFVTVTAASRSTKKVR